MSGGWPGRTVVHVVSCHIGPRIVSEHHVRPPPSPNMPLPRPRMRPVVRTISWSSACASDSCCASSAIFAFLELSRMLNCGASHVRSHVGHGPLASKPW
eukprot:100344-Chlamydomonas_euryale.AAC.6